MNISRRLICTTAVLCAFALSAAASAAESGLPAYQAAQSVSGNLRIWGSPADAALLKDWQAGFARFHPQATFSNQLHGTESTMAGVYTRVADLAFLTRELRNPVERMAFEWVYRRPPFGIEVANAGIATDRPAANLAVFVHAGNPLSQLTLAQLDAAFGAEHRRGQAHARTWGDLGLQGEWKTRPVHVVGPSVDSIAALSFRRTVMNNSQKWNPEIHEIAYDDQNAPVQSDPAVVAAVAADPLAIGYAALRGAASGVKPLALAEKDGAEAVALTAPSVVARTYPLTRSISMVLDRDPAQPLAPALREFLRYVLSREGQEAVVRDGAYLPLSAATAAAQLKRLD